MSGFVFFASILGAGLFCLSVFRENRVRDPAALRTAWLLFVVTLPLAALAEAFTSRLLWVATWLVAAVVVAFVHFALDPMFPPDPGRSADEPARSRSNYEPVLPPPDDTSHIPIPPEVPQI